MKIHLGTLPLLASLLLPGVPMWAASASHSDLLQSDSESHDTVTWSTEHVLHLIGLPDTKANTHGTLSLTATTLGFSNDSAIVNIPRQLIRAVSVDTDRVELWGRKGQILRMMIPEGGGLMAAAFMHHRISILTIGFADAKGALHEAVFVLPSADADRILRALSQNLSSNLHLPSAEPCRGAAALPHSVIVSVSQDAVDVPTAYRALLYEQLIDRLKRTKGIERVYRPEVFQRSEGCPRYTVRVSISSFKQGNQVERAVTGPIGMFVGATKMNFNVTLSDSIRSLETHDSIQAAVRSQSENLDIAKKAAQKISKQIAKDLKQLQKTSK